MLTDVVMPGLSGREVVTRVQARRPGIRVVYTSGYNEDAIVKWGVESRQAAFIEKPYTPDQLRQAVLDALTAEDHAG